MSLPKLAPQLLLHDLTSLELGAFLACRGDALLLLVRLAPGDADLELGLDSASGGGGPKPLPFRTTHEAPIRARRNSRPPGSPVLSLEARRAARARVVSFLEKNVCVAVPLQKKGSGDAAFPDRISVGRAQNKDIVLRHPSISKFHAWFEVDDSQGVQLFDSGSTNRTLIDGRPIEPKIGTAIASGDHVQFGAVEALLCSPETLWWCLNRREDDPMPE